MSIPVALIITSNDLDNQLHQIDAERKHIEDALRHYHNNFQLLVISSPYTSIDHLFKLLNEHSGNIVLLHFAGHFGGGLQLNDNQLKTETANNKGIANVLGKEAQDGILKFVFLNGCSTKSLVDALRAENVPSIIGTNYPVADGKATTFANAFYRKLANADAENPFAKQPTAISDAFEFALSRLESKNTIRTYETKRGFAFDIKEVETEELWELDTTNKNWFLPNKKYKPKEKKGQIAAISCDRTEISRRFEISLDKKEHLPCQFYFLAEQPYGEVESILKRLVYHIIDEKPKAKPVNYDDITPVEIDSIDNSSQEDIEYFLRKSFNKDFSKQHQVKRLQELIDAIPTNHPHLRSYTHVPYYFKINMTNKCWQERVQPALKWFIKTFSKVEPCKYHFIFFFIINIRESKKKVAPQKSGFFSSLFGKKETEQVETIDIYDSLVKFSKDLEEVTTLPPLKKVKRQDIDDWYRLIQKVSNAADRKIQVDAFIEKIVERTDHEEPWDMSYVESELKKIIEAESNAAYGI